jgi:hypothetical protein
MKLLPSRRSRPAGIFLVECMVYLVVFTILVFGAMTVFYFCWDHSQAIVYATDDIGTAVNAGELWRKDIRSATGKISVQTDATSQTVLIPHGRMKVIYRFSTGEVRRQDSGSPQLLLSRVKASQMLTELRGGVTAWRWEVELSERSKETHLPLIFTFEAAQMNP